MSELENGSATSPCPAALALGETSKRWVDGLRSVFEQARSEAPAVRYPLALSAINAPAFEDEVVSHPARQLAADLGSRIGQFARVAPDLADAPASAALARFFPDLNAEGWAEVALAAAVRAYVPAIDPHGEWAPLDEEWALFAGDPIDGEEPSLWSNMVRTPLGVRIVDHARSPLEIDDLVLSVDGTLTAGLSVEQVEQLARVEPPQGQSVRSVRVLRGTGSNPSPLELSIAFPQDGAEAGEPLPASRVRYGAGWAQVITISEVGDRLGDDLADALALARQDDDPPLGVVLDLRGNGGGSTDGAAAAIGLFLPGAPSFPLIHRGAVSEVMRASAPEANALWTGPGRGAGRRLHRERRRDDRGRDRQLRSRSTLGRTHLRQGLRAGVLRRSFGAGGAAPDHAARGFARRFRAATGRLGAGMVARVTRGRRA